MNINTTQIILASKSPRRKELMHQAGFNFSINASGINEVITKEKSFEIAMELSRQKALNIYHTYTSFSKDTLIIGADTIVYCNNKIMGKPSDEDEAFQMLKEIQDNIHHVYTGITLIFHNCKIGVPSPIIQCFYEVTEVSVCKMTDSEILTYISSGDYFDKAGAYGIQDSFGIFVNKINGDYNNVVGLPISRLYHEIINM